MSSKSHAGLDPAQREFVKLIRANATRYRLHEVFRDFCEMAALSISNSVDRSQYAAREAAFLTIEARYSESERARFSQMLAQVVVSLESGFSDCLGQLFMTLELGDHWKGQFFTPYAVSGLMARLTMGDPAHELERRGFVTVNEPACGAGGMLIAFADTLRERGLNHSQSMHAVAVDIDPTAVHMTYIQLSLIGVPAIVVHGNALWPSEKPWSQWATPVHVWGGWDERLALRDQVDAFKTLLAGAPLQHANCAHGDAVAAVPSRRELIAQRRSAAEQMDLF